MVGKPDWSSSIGGENPIYSNIKDVYDDLVRYRSGWESVDGFAEPWEEVEFAESSIEGDIETQFDFYNFNFHGKSGKFLPVLDDPSGSVSFIETPYQNMKISPALQSDFSEDGNWIITAADGTTYTFLYSDAEKTRTTGENGSGYQYVSAWYLSEIVGPNELDRITFEYDTDTETDPGTGQQTEKYHQNMNLAGRNASDQIRIGSSIANCPCYQESHIRNTAADGGDYSSEGTKKYLKTIKLNGKVAVEFIHSTEPRLDLPGRRILDKIIIKDYTNEGGSEYELKRFLFTYDYFVAEETKTVAESDENELRLKLLSIQEIGALPSTIQYASVINEKPAYRFEYSDVRLPARDSYAMDFWGYYNGVNTNTRLLPMVTFDGVTYDGADRRGKWEFARAGILEKIYYPTGGYTEFDYEGHEVYDAGTFDLEEEALLYHIPGGDYTPDCPSNNGIYSQYYVDDDAIYDVTCPIVSSMPFEIELDQDVEVKISASGSVPGTKFQVVLIRQGRPIDQVSETEVWRSYNTNQTTSISLTEGRYRLIFFNGVTSQQVTARVKMQVPFISYDEVKTNIGGVRIRKITDYDNLTEGKTIIKEYLYTNELSKLSSNAPRSTGNLIIKPRLSYISKWVRQSVKVRPFDTESQSNQFRNDDEYTVTYLNRVGTGLSGVNSVGGAHVGYSEVIEYTTDESGNRLGAKGQHFKTYGTFIQAYPVAPTPNLGDLNGALEKEVIYDNNNDWVSTTTNTYEEESRHSIQGLVISQDYAWNYFFCKYDGDWYEYERNGNFLLVTKERYIAEWLGGDESLWDDSLIHSTVQMDTDGDGVKETIIYVFTTVNCSETTKEYNYKYTSRSYGLESYAQYMTSSVTQQRESASGPVIETRQDYYYDNTEDHYQPTRVRMTDSEGVTLETLTRYAIDFDRGANPVINKLVDQNRLFTPVDQAIFKDDGSGRKLIGNVHTAYSQSQESKIFPHKSYLFQSENGLVNSEFETQSVSYTEDFPEAADHSLEKTLSFDPDGNIRMAETKDGHIKQYRWGYDNRYPVFEVSHSKEYPFVYEGFEYANMSGTINNRDQAASGEWFKDLQGQPYTVTIIGLESGKEGDYMLRYFWRNDLNSPWQIMHEPVTFAAQATASINTSVSTGYIDEVMLYRKGAAASSYAFYPGVGMQSAVSPDGTRVRYDYDKLGRLSLLRDQNLDILKRYEYQYACQYAWQAYIDADRATAVSGQPIVFTAHSDETVSRYEWTILHGINTVELSSNTQSVTYTPPECGAVTARVRLINEEGLPMHLEKTLPGEQVPVIVSISGPATSASQQSQSYTASASGGCGNTYTYKWEYGRPGQTNRSFAGNLITMNHTFRCGDEIIYVTATDREGNSGTASLPVSVDNTLTAGIAGPSSLTYGDTNIFTSTRTGGCGTYSYTWEVAYDLNNRIVAGTDADLVLPGDCSGPFALFLTITDGQGNTGTVSRSINGNASYTLRSQTYDEIRCDGQYTYVQAYVDGGCNVSERAYQWYRPVTVNSVTTWEPISGAVSNSLYMKNLNTVRFEIKEGSLSGYWDFDLTPYNCASGTSPCDDPNSNLPCYDGNEPGID